MRQSALLGSTNSTRKRWECVKGGSSDCNNFVAFLVVSKPLIQTGKQWEIWAFHHWNIIKGSHIVAAGTQHGLKRTNLAMFLCLGLWYWVVFALMHLQDSFQEHYAQTGCFPGPTVSPARRPWALINWLFWSCLLLYPLGLLLVQLISSGSMLTISASVVVCSAGWFHTLEVRSPWYGFGRLFVFILMIQIIFVTTYGTRMTTICNL